MSDLEKPLYLCLDQGGHASRAIVVDAAGRQHASAFVEIATRRDGPRVEHDPAELVDSLRSAAAQALQSLQPAARERVIAAGLATQRSSLLCWERDSGAALTPVLSWQDVRGADWLEGFAGAWTEVHQLTGLALSPHYGASKLRWCLDHVPAVRSALNSGNLVGGPLASFLAARLTGNFPACADAANASRTLLWDRHTCNWSPQLLSLFGIPANILPQSVPSACDWGRIAIADRSIPLTLVTGDQSAALFAFGMPDRDTVYINLGTGAFAQRFSPMHLEHTGRLLASVVFRDAQRSFEVLEGTVNGAGSAIATVAAERSMAMDFVRQNSARWLEEAEELPLFVNAVAGLGSPWWRTDIASRLVGPADDAAAIAAVMESIAFLLATNLRAMREVAGPSRRLICTGGLSRVTPLLQRLANLAGLPVERAEVREATATGLAWLLAGRPASWPAHTRSATCLPQPDAMLEGRFRRWQELMPAP